MARKLLSIITALFVAFSVIPVGVSAEGTEKLTSEEMIKETIEPELTHDKLPLDVAETDATNERSLEGKAYAVLTEAGDFIFFRSMNDYENGPIVDAIDLLGNKYSGRVYSVEESDPAMGYMPGWFWNGDGPQFKEQVKTVRVAEKQQIKPKSMNYWFSGFKNMTDIDLHGLNSSECKSMRWIFGSCVSLKQLDVSCLDTANVIYMDGMFALCENLKILNLGNIDTSSCFEMSEMFKECRKLEELDLSGFVTDNVRYFVRMFEYCVNLKYLDISSFNTSGIQPFETDTELDEMCDMFYRLDSLTAIKLGKKMVKWEGDAYHGSHSADLPDGTWINKALNLSLTSKELREQYPSNAEKWAGLWEKESDSPTGVTLDQSNCTLLAGKSVTLQATVLPANTEEKKVTWTSSEEKIATVDQSGTVKGIKPGYATITATTSNGLTATSQVRVLFTDIPAEGKYYSNPVYWAVEKGITNGYTDSDGIIRTFKPQNNCTREAVVTFLWRLAGRPEPKNLNSPFSDIQDRGKYYYKSVLWAAEKGITKGYSDGTFKPNATCLREHVVTFLYRYAGQPIPKTSKNPFNDVKTSDYYYKPVLWANEKGIANGYSTGEYAGGFGPKLDCLREHVVTFLYRYAK